MAHQASNLFLPLASPGHVLVEPLLLGMGPPAPFPPGFIGEVGFASPGAELWVLRAEGAAGEL